jgi:hypothetical protein
MRRLINPDRVYTRSQSLSQPTNRYISPHPPPPPPPPPPYITRSEETTIPPALYIPCSLSSQQEHLHTPILLERTQQYIHLNLTPLYQTKNHEPDRNDDASPRPLQPPTRRSRGRASSRPRWSTPLPPRKANVRKGRSAARARRLASPNSAAWLYGKGGEGERKDGCGVESLQLIDAVIALLSSVSSLSPTTPFDICVSSCSAASAGNGAAFSSRRLRTLLFRFDSFLRSAAKSTTPASRSFAPYILKTRRVAPSTVPSMI